MRLLLLRSKRRVAPLPHPSLGALGAVGCKPLWPTGALGVGCWNTDTSTTRCPARLLPAVTASRMVMFASLNRALRPGAVDFGALGPRALGGAGSPPNMAPGRWVFGREYLDDDESYFDSKTRSGILGTYITFPEGDLRIGGGWFLGVGCSVGVGCWALGRGGVGCSNAEISTTGRRISIPRPAVALPGAVVSFLSRACPYLAVGSWALGGAGSPPRRWVPGRWVFERGYLRDQAPDLAPETAYGIPGVPITLPKEGLRIGKGWFLGVGCWALGVGRWVLGVGCLNVNISTTGRPVLIPRPDLASPRLTLGTPRRARRYLAAGFWALGAEGVG